MKSSTYTYTQVLLLGALTVMAFLAGLYLFAVLGVAAMVAGVGLAYWLKHKKDL